jgi:predicted acylesterase/phospholipase RssA
MKQFSILALSGGGTKGLLHLGALQELENRGGNLTKLFNKGIYGCSIGSVIGTAIAFGVNTTNISSLTELLNFNFIYNGLNLESLRKSAARKGIFEMDTFDDIIIQCFDKWSIDIKNKKLSDSIIPLKIVSSNMTKGVPTIFKGDIPVLTALRASCCVPGLFRPQIINNSVYIDGGYFTTVLMKIIPRELTNETLAIDIIHTNPRITPENLETMSVTEYLYKFYKLSCLYEVGQYTHPNIVNVYHNSGSGFSDPKKSEKAEMIQAGRSFMRSFLAKRGL